MKPAQAEGVVFDDGAARLILDAAENFPYFIQEWGFQVWNAASASPITTAMAHAASPDVVAHLDNNFFRVRFDRLTPLEQKYLRAMAELGPGPHGTGRIAETLGVRSSTVATVRRHLIEKGMVWSQRHGETSFTVPMFDAFMKRQMPKLLKAYSAIREAVREPLDGSLTLSSRNGKMRRGGCAMMAGGCREEKA